MKLLINGENRTVQDVKTLRTLLQSLDINPNGVVIEHNQSVVSRKKLEEVLLQEGDQVEIVHFVGGGSEETIIPIPAETIAQETPEEKPKAKKAAPKKAKKKAEDGTTAVVKKVRRAKAADDGPTSKARNLVIVESPAKAKTINKFLGDDYQVEASYGHVRDLPKSKMGVEIQKDFEPNYIVINKARKTVTNLKKQAKGKTNIFLAPDPDREGEAISWHLGHIFREDQNPATVRRVVFNEITKDAIKEAFKHPRDIQMNLVDAQQARRILDRIVGYELSPLLWKKVGRGLSAGRVQSVALRLIVEREREIRAFVPQEYWSLELKVASEKPQNVNKPFIAKLDKIGNEKAELKDSATTEKIKDEVSKLPLKIDKVDKRERSRNPQAPYTTSKLQQEAFTRLGFPAAKTMRVAQKLYEGIEIGAEGTVGLITYMRTDSVNISVSAQAEAADYIRQKFGDKYLPPKPPFYKSKKNAQEAHEAVRPSSAKREPEAIRQYLSDEEFKLYDLIWKKFVSSQMVPAIDENIAVTILAGDKYTFKANGRRNIFPGFGIVFTFASAPAVAEAKDEKEKEEESAEEMELPQLEAGELLKLLDVMGNQHFTKPPARFNDASIVKTLEEQGIGRPSTYAPTIFTLLYREYVTRRGSALMPSELGETVVDLLVEHFPKVLDVQFTATMETELDKIEEGELQWQKVIMDFYKPFEADVLVAREQMKSMKQDPIPTEHPCPVCGKIMVIKWGRFGKFMACSGFPECKTARPIPLGVKCPEPNCGGDLVKRLSKKRRVFYGCSNYPACTHISNKLPQPSDALSEDEKVSDEEKGTVEP